MRPPHTHTHTLSNFGAWFGCVSNILIFFCIDIIRAAPALWHPAQQAVRASRQSFYGDLLRLPAGISADGGCWRGWLQTNRFVLCRHAPTVSPISLTLQYFQKVAVHTVYTMLLTTVFYSNQFVRPCYGRGLCCQMSCPEGHFNILADACL